MEPSVGRSEPVIMLASVLLPLPLAPTRPIADPGGMVNETLSTAVNVPLPRPRTR